MDMTATLLVLLISAVDPNDGSYFDELAFEVAFVVVNWECFVEGGVVGGRELQQVVVVSEGVQTHLQLIRCDILISFHSSSAYL